MLTGRAFSPFRRSWLRNEQPLSMLMQWVNALNMLCFLSYINYNDVPNDKRKDPNSYEQWGWDISFEDLDVDNISINDISKIERLNNLKINIHVWENGKLTIRYNNRQVVPPKQLIYF